MVSRQDQPGTTRLPSTLLTCQARQSIRSRSHLVQESQSGAKTSQLIIIVIVIVIVVVTRE